MNPGAAIEASMLDLFWLPEHVEVRRRPELCCLRSKDPVLHYNAALRCHPTLAETRPLVREISDWHQAGCSRVHLYPSNRTAALESALVEHGYTASSEHDAMAVQVRAYVGRSTNGLIVRRVESMQEMRDCAEVLQASLGVPPPHSRAQWEEQLAACTGENTRTHRYVVYDASSLLPLSSGGLNLYPTLGIGQLWGGGTVPTGRRRGAYSALVSARVEAVRSAGLAYITLFARHGESMPIVAKQGFEAFGRMTTWDRSSEQAQRVYARIT